MESPETKGYAIESSDVTTWMIFNREAITWQLLTPINTGRFPNNEWVTIRFPEPRVIRGWAIQFVAQTLFSCDIEGRSSDGTWEPVHNFVSTQDPPNNAVNVGRYGAVTNTKECNAIRIRTNNPNWSKSCQFFGAVPLVPVDAPTNMFEPTNSNLRLCFVNQDIAYTYGTNDWYIANGDNKGGFSTSDQIRFQIHFTSPKTVGGFAVAGITSHSADNCYANCLRIEGRASANDPFRLLKVSHNFKVYDEVEFDPAKRETQYFDFLEDHVVWQLRITVQDVTRKNASLPVYLPPMQVYGM